MGLTGLDAPALLGWGLRVSVPGVSVLCAGVSRVTVALNLNARRHHARSVKKEGPQAGCHSRSFTKRKIDPTATPVPVSILLSFPCHGCWLLGAQRRWMEEGDIRPHKTIQ